MMVYICQGKAIHINVVGNKLRVSMFFSSCKKDRPQALENKVNKIYSLDASQKI